MAGEKKPPPARKRSSEARGLSEDEEALWRKVAETAKPLAKVKRAERKLDTQPGPPESEASKPKAPVPAASKPAVPRHKAPAPGERAKPKIPDLESGRAAGIDRRSLERLRRGKMPIEATLDLHGDTQTEAHRRLGGFLARAQAAERRCVLIITGKGRIRFEGEGRETGVIRASLPRWLNEGPNRERVLAFAQAQPAHGGAGAFYVLLRRRRPNATKT